jgi:glycosyltransferase involved in cell wall biosynthesis
VTSLPEVVEHSAVVVDPYDVEAIHAAMRELVSNTTRRQQLAVASIEQAKTFSWRAAASRVLELYRQLAGEYPRSIERKPVGVGAVDAS